ncbi:MAG TPA: hypothetical protein PLS38_04505, partial [Solirubrobacterales bacterium]|nr:hypothetical protein [Solirubrobacterales bacterium]
MPGIRFRGILVSAAFAVLPVFAAPAVSSAGDDPGTSVLEVRFSRSASLRGDEASLRAASEPALDRVEKLFERIGTISAEPLAAGVSQ